MLFVSAPSILPFARYELMPLGWRMAYCLGEEERISPGDVLKRMDCKEKPAVQVFRVGQHLGVSFSFPSSLQGWLEVGRIFYRCGRASASPCEAKGSATLTSTTSLWGGSGASVAACPCGAATALKSKGRFGWTWLVIVRQPTPACSGVVAAHHNDGERWVCSALVRTCCPLTGGRSAHR
jgi:hypothetical protein